MNSEAVNIFVACFHSQPSKNLNGCSGQFETVERAIQDQLWPYDNGDDPAFYVARNHSGPVTWGVCRRNVRSFLKRDDIVAFISYTKTLAGKFVYRLCSVATVADKLDHRFAYEDARLSGKPYINLLIRAVDGKEEWLHNETDRPVRARHDDWLWRIAEHPLGVPKEMFKHGAPDGRIRANSRIAGYQIQMADNYVIFSAKPTETYICEEPPVIAEAKNGSNENWKSLQVRKVLLEHPEAAAPRNYIRSSNAYGFAHPYITWSVPHNVGARWRSDLITAVEKCRYKGNGEQLTAQRMHSRCS